MTTYVSDAVLTQAQEELERHLVAGHDGRCLTCRELEPCAKRIVLYTLFNGVHRLPRREPGRAGINLTHRRSGPR